MSQAVQLQTGEDSLTQTQEDRKVVSTAMTCDCVVGAVRRDGQSEEVQSLVRQAYAYGMEYGREAERQKFDAEHPIVDTARAWRTRALRAEQQAEVLAGRARELDEELAKARRMVQEAHNACKSEAMSCPWCGVWISYDQEEHHPDCDWLKVAK